MMTITDKNQKRALILSGGGGRGAFQVGVLKYLEEIGWDPDMICGTSVGAINAAACGSGLSADQMRQLWEHNSGSKIFRLTLPTLLRSMKSRRRFVPLSDTRPLARMLKTHINFDAIAASPRKICISALNMQTGQICYFTNHAIRIPHLMAASAIPGLFGWQYIDNIPYWDAGVMVNTPIAPALQSNAEEIIVVLHSPVGAFSVPEPRCHGDVTALLVEHLLTGSYINALPDHSWQTAADSGCRRTPLARSPQLQLAAGGRRILPVAPTRMLGLRSFLNFSRQQAVKLIEEGYNCARMQLKNELKIP